VIRASPLRFLLTVSPPAAWLVIAFAGSVMLGLATLWLNPEGIDAAFASILLLQMFAASNVFSASASRGYFDPLLTGEHSRQRIAVGSLAAAALPGLVAWILLALLAAAFGRWRIAVAPHRYLALAMVSVFSWGGGIALPRVAVGPFWLLVLLSAALFREVLATYMPAVQSPPTSALDFLQWIGAFALCPFLLLGDVPAANDSTIVASDLILLLIVTWWAVRYVERRDYALVDRA
jgi:hypothetical protein